MSGPAADANAGAAGGGTHGPAAAAPVPGGADAAATRGTATSGASESPDAAADEALLLRHLAGDLAAFERLYARYRLPTYRFLRRLLERVDAADDVFQELWLQVVEQAATYRRGHSVRTWLFTLARSRAYDRMRREAVRARTFEARHDGSPQAEAGAYPGAGADDPEASRLQLERARLLQDALRTLPEEQRVVFLLREEAELSLPEAADSLGIPYETAKSRYRYALARLRAHFGVGDRSGRT